MAKDIYVVGISESHNATAALVKNGELVAAVSEERLSRRKTHMGFPKRAIKEVYGIEARPIGVGGGTVAAFFRKAGLPAAVWSTQSDTAHQPNEYALISHIISDHEKDIEPFRLCFLFILVPASECQEYQ